MFFIYCKEDGFYFYKCTEKINGKKITIEFDEWYNLGKYTYNVCLLVKRKKNKNTWLKSTGGGLSFLLWAKKKIIEFEEYILETREQALSIKIYCGWDDNRRGRVYEYGLKKLGYKLATIFNKKYLVKNLK